MKLIKIIIAGGGSAGHLFPGIALADKLTITNPKKEILFLGFKTQIEKKILKNTKYRFISSLEENFDIKQSKLRSILNIPRLVLKAKNILYKFEPQLVISVGGYYAIPIGIAAKMKNVPFVVCEQNIIPGIANQLLSIISDKIYTSFEKTIGLKHSHKIVFSGNPVRKNIFDSNNIKYTKQEKSKIKKKFTILILGGSQGASAINSAIMDSLHYIKKIDNLRLIHQTGFRDEEKLINIYKYKKIDAVVKSFFNNIGKCYAEADMVICRAGATTIAELMIAGKGSLIIPYPLASRNHQQLNAQFLVDNGSAKLILQKNLSGFNLAKNINNFVNNPNKLAIMASKIKLLRNVQAAQVITSDIQTILEQRECI